MRVLVWGAGGHGHVVAEALERAGYQVAGWIDRDPGRREKCWPEPADTAELQSWLSGDGLDAVALGLGDNRRRREIALLCGDWLAAPVVHPDATVSTSASLGDGTVVLARAVVNARASIGRAVIVNSGAIVEHDCRVGASVHLSPGAVLGGGVAVGHGAWIGAGAVVLPGLTIGECAVVGAGAAVTKDVASNMTVVGVPAGVLDRLRGRT